MGRFIHKNLPTILLEGFVYRCEVKNVSGFLQQVAVNYVGRGYWFYVQGIIPPEKEAARTDQKIITQYGLDVTKWINYRRRQRGEASVQYVRHENQFLILATPGSHRFFEEEKRIQDVRRVPIKVCGYSIGHHETPFGPRVSVRLEQRHFKALKKTLQSNATVETAETLATYLNDLHFEFYAPVCQQVAQMIRAINRARRQAHLELVNPANIFRLRQSRKIFKLPTAY